MADLPCSNIHFQVEWGGSRLGFSEISDFSLEVETIEYREGGNPDYNVMKMPGMSKFSNIILKRGIVAGDNEFYEWLNTIQLNQVERRDIRISLLNENHEPVINWKVINAFPVKLTAPSLKGIGSDVAIETLEIAHEGLVIEAV